MFIAATTMLTRTYRPPERIQAQTLNDFLVFGAQATASLMAGLALATIGWRQLNLATLPLIGAVLVALLATGRQRRALPPRRGRGSPDLGDDRLRPASRARRVGSGSSWSIGWASGGRRWLPATIRRRTSCGRVAASSKANGGAAAEADQVHLLQAQLVDQVDDRGGVTGDRPGASFGGRSRRCPAGRGHRPSGRCRAAPRSG